MRVLFRHNKASILAEDNPTLVELETNHNSLIKRFNELNRTLLEITPPRYLTKKVKRNLNEVGKSVRSLQMEMYDWEVKCFDFIKSPSLTFFQKDRPSHDEMRHIEKHLVFLFSQMRNEMYECRQLLLNNYHSIVAESRSNRDFVLTWIGLAIGFIGVVLSILFSGNVGNTELAIRESEKIIEAPKEIDETPDSSTTDSVLDSSVVSLRFEQASADSSLN